MHIVGGNSRSRARQSEIVFAIGHQAELYSDLMELVDRAPGDGMIIALQDVVDFGVDRLLEDLADHGIWIPVVVARTDPDVEEIVQAIHAGALDFLPLPLTENELRRVVAHLTDDAGFHTATRRRLINARHRISGLSNREREVLDFLSKGFSNKAIARELEISPRTVEIHRANMMQKLGAGNAAEAVRLRLEAGLEDARRRSLSGLRRGRNRGPAPTTPSEKILISLQAG